MKKIIKLIVDIVLGLIGLIGIAILLIPSLILAILESAITTVIFESFFGKKAADVALSVSFFIFAAINVCYKLFKIYKENQALENEINASIKKNRVIPGHKLVKNLKKHNR